MRFPLSLILLFLGLAGIVPAQPVPLVHYTFEELLLDGAPSSGEAASGIRLLGGDGPATPGIRGLAAPLHGPAYALDPGAFAETEINELTICGWVHSDALFEHGTVWIDHMDDFRSGFRLYNCDARGTLRFEVRQKGTEVHSQVDSEQGFLATGRWTFFAASFNGRRDKENLRLYRASNASVVLEPAATASSEVLAPVAAAKAPLAIGASIAGTRQLQGCFDEIRLYDRELSPSEIERVRAGDAGQTPEKHLRILPIGDSITEGCCGAPYSVPYGAGGYRYYLEQIFLDQSFAYDFLGEQRNGSMETGGTFAAMFDPEHEGVGGQNIRECAERIRSRRYIQRYEPDVILLHIGTIDMEWRALADHVLDYATLRKNFDELLDEIGRQAPPSASILVATIIRAPAMAPHVDRRIREYNDTVVRPAVEERAAKNERWRLVDMYPVLGEESDFADIGHPNDSGHRKMAEAWWAQLRLLEKPQ